MVFAGALAIGCSGGSVTESPDASAADTGPVDTGVADAGPVDTGVADADVADAGSIDASPADVSCSELRPCDASTSDSATSDAATSDVPTLERAAIKPGRFSTLGVRGWAAGAVRIVDDELESGDRQCTGAGATTVCVSGGFLQ